MKKDKVALFLLRFGLGAFLLLWGVDKLVAPDKTVGIFSHFYKVPITEYGAQLVGWAEILLSLAIILGVWKTYSYGLGLLLHAVSTLSSYRQLLSPFGQNHLFIAAIPILFAFIALFLLRDQDTLWACRPGKRKARKASSRKAPAKKAKKRKRRR